MEIPSIKYILLYDRFGFTLERNPLSLGFTTNSTPTPVLRGEILEGLPEPEQPRDLNRIALVGIDRKSLHLECRMDDLVRLEDEDANLLLAISSSKVIRYQTLTDRKSLAFGQQLLPGSWVFVKVKGISKDLPGVVRYRGELPPNLGTWFGVELIRHPGRGQSDGTFRNKQYFHCAPDSGVFVGLDKLRPREDSDESLQANFKPRLNITVPSFWNRKYGQKSPQDRSGTGVKIDQRVVTLINNYPAGASVRYIGQEKDSSGNVQTVVGLELDERLGSGTGMRSGTHLFVCKRDYAAFVPIEAVIPEKVFHENPEQPAGWETLEKEEQIEHDDSYTKSIFGALSEETRSNRMRADVVPRGFEVGSKVEIPMVEGPPKYGIIRWIGNLPQVKDKLVAGLELEEDQSACSDGTCHGERYFTCPAQRGFFAFLETCRPDSRITANTPNCDREEGKQEELQKMENQLAYLQKQLRVKEEHAANLTAQLEQNGNLQRHLTRTEQELSEKIEQENILHMRLREKEQQVTHFQAQLRDKELEQANLNGQLREKEQREENSRRQLSEMRQQLTNVQGQLQQRNLLEANLREQLRRKDQQLLNSEGQLREVTQQVTNVQRQLQEKDEETANLQNQVTTLEGRLREKDQEINELETSLLTTQETLTEYQRKQSPDWVISRDQIQLTDKLLGKGGWGSVVEGKYCGCAVAVKQIHELILSPHNQSLFEREMDIASRCRHPCLLQFIGATNDEGSPLFVTELMETSLRALLEQRSLSTTEITVVSLDVARALNYLHQKEPSPIIHRDISSANVLLWRQGDQWRGKVSDYGTANFMRHTMTIAPGNVIYSAPEALTKNQTVKVDVYSFGVLLCEMCRRELPDPEKREQQVALVKNKLLRALIRGCLEAEPEARPSVQEIINELEEPD